MTPRTATIWLVLALWLCGLGPALAQDPTTAIEELKKEMKDLRQEISAKDKKIDDLENRLNALQKTVSATPAKKPVQAVAAKPAPPAPQTTGDNVVKAVQGPKETNGQKQL